MKANTFVYWILIILVAALAFYMVYPKYEFERTGSIWMLRYNKITGTGDICLLNGQKLSSVKLSEELNRQIKDEFKRQHRGILNYE